MKRARAILQAEYKSNPTDVRTRFLLSEVLEAFKKYDEALQFAEQALATDPNNADYHYEVALICGEMAEKANVFKQLALARRSKKEAETAIQLNPKHVDARNLLVNFYAEAPSIAGGDKQKAREMLAEVERLNPVDAASDEADIARNEKNEAGIEAAVVKEARLGPRDYDGQMEAANYFSSDTQKKYDVAEKYARAARQLDPARAGAYSVLAIVFAATQRLDALDELLVQAEKNVPDNLVPFFQAGRTLLERGKEPARAESYFRKYLTQEPEAGSPSLEEARKYLKRLKP